MFLPSFTMPIETLMPVSKNRRKNKNKKKKAPVKVKKKAVALQSSSLPDRRTLEKMMAQITEAAASPDMFEDDGLFDSSEHKDPLWQAQELMYEAWEARPKRDRVALAKQALAISDLCADAYILLAEEAAKNIVEEKHWYELAVDAGRKALGEELFEDGEGDFWLILETRPYMRARAGLAECLWNLGEREEAVGHVQDMLRLNPGDNQGMRYILKSWLFTVGDLKGVSELLVEYDEDCFAEWCYSKALLIFRQSGSKSSGAIKALKYAVKTNPFVTDLLLGTKRMPKTLPPHYSIGSKDEAVIYVAQNRDNWSATKGALQWLAENT
jgi:tetratricopeptide (TPR) repeat protein